MDAAWLTEAQSQAAIRARLLYEAAIASHLRDRGDGRCGHLSAAQVAVRAGTPAFSSPPAPPNPSPSTSMPAKRTGPHSPWLARPHRQPSVLAIQDDTRITLVDRPSVAGTLYVEGYRVPLRAWPTTTTSQKSTRRTISTWCNGRCTALSASRMPTPATLGAQPPQRSQVHGLFWPAARCRHAPQHPARRSADQQDFLAIDEYSRPPVWFEVWCADGNTPFEPKGART